MQQGRRRAPLLGGGVVWMSVWIGAMIVAGALIVSAVLRGDWGPVPILAVWLGFAGYALWRVGRGLAHRVGGAPPPPRARRGSRHVWHDDVADRGDR